MNNITYAVSVDVNNPIIPYNVYVASVLDSNVRYLEITLYQNGNVIALSNEATATASLVTDNVLVNDSVNCTIQDNIITVPLEDLQRHGNLDVQVTVAEGEKVLAIPFPIQVRVTPNIAENAQIDENSLGSYAEVVQEIVNARGGYTTLQAALAAKANAAPGSIDETNLSFTPVKYVGSNDLDECINSGVLYRVHDGSAYQLVICSLGTYAKTQYMFTQHGTVKSRTMIGENAWSSWKEIATEDNLSALTTQINSALAAKEDSAAAEQGLLSLYGKNAVYTHSGTESNPNPAVRRYFFPTPVEAGKTLRQVQLYLKPAATDSTLRIELWQHIGGAYYRSRELSFDIFANSGNRVRAFDVSATCEHETYISLLIQGSATYGVSRVTGQELCYYATDLSSVQLNSLGNPYYNLSIAGALIVDDLSNVLFGGLVNSGNYRTLLPSLDDFARNAVFAVNQGNTSITGYPPHSFLGGQNVFISLVGKEGQHTTGDIQKMINRVGLEATRTWTGAAWSAWLYSPRCHVVTNSNYTTYLPSLDDCTDNVNASIIMQDTPIVGYPQGFNGSMNLFSSVVHVAGTHTLGDLQTLTDRNNKRACRTWQGSAWSSWVYSTVYPSELNLTVDGDNFAAKLKEGNASSASKINILVKSGVHDVAAELADYFESASALTECVMNKDCTITFESGAKVVCNYTGSNAFIMQQFSIVTTKAGSLEIINGDFEGSKIRYIIHDDHESGAAAYWNRYSDCRMYLDNHENTAFSAICNCIGCGFGMHAHIVVEGGYYKHRGAGGDKTVLRFHNAGAQSGGAKSHVAIRNVYIENGTIGVYSYGASTEKSIVEVCGCRLTAEPVEGMSSGATIVNMECIKWNNEIAEV